MKKSTLSKCFALLVLAWLCASCSMAAAQPAQSVKYKAVPIEAWETLRQNNQVLVLKLAEVRLQVAALRKQSEEVNQRLAEAEKLLTKSQQELTNLNGSLANASELQDRTQKSLQNLTTQIDEERKKQQAIQNRLRLQRTFAYILLGLAVIHK